jgi:hypothetical protein
MRRKDAVFLQYHEKYLILYREIMMVFLFFFRIIENS